MVSNQKLKNRGHSEVGCIESNNNNKKLITIINKQHSYSLKALGCIGSNEKKPYVRACLIILWFLLTSAMANMLQSFFKQYNCV